MSRRADPGSPRSALVAWIATVLLVGAVVFLNQFGKPAPREPVDPAAETIKAPGILNSTAVVSKMVVKLVQVLKSQQEGEGTLNGATFLPRIDEQAKSPVDRLRVAMVAGELAGPEAALKRLADLEQRSDVPEGFGADVATVRRVLEAERPAELPEDLREGLVARHGWFAKLALSRGLDDAAAERAPLVEGGLRVGIIVALLVLILLTVVLAGVGSLVTFVILLATGRITRRFVPPLPGGSAFLEVLPVFAGGFLLIKLVMPWLIVGPDGTVPEWGLKAQLVVQWLLVPACLWPLVRGCTWSDLRHRIGWHRGEGWLKEIALGLFGYFAMLPALGVVFLVTVRLVNAVKGPGTDGEPPVENPIIEIMAHAGTLEMVMFFLLATCWAPFVEETVFRGAFFGHLRARLSLMGAAGVSAMAFGVMHGYEYLMLGPVILLGFTFALIREWRGTIVGCMAAHFVHNAATLTLLTLLLPVLRD
jgi:membrane protease YdiL (CAAX protease family)